MKVRRHPASTLYASQWALWSATIVPTSIASSIVSPYFITNNTGSGLTIIAQKATFAAAEIAWVAMCNGSSADLYLGGSSRDSVTRCTPFTEKIENSIVVDR